MEIRRLQPPALMGRFHKFFIFISCPDTDKKIYINLFFFSFFLNVISLCVCNFLWEDNWYCTSLIVILLSLCLPNHFLSVYKNMSDCMQKHPAADVLISFASLRSAYESTLETLSYKQVRGPWDACMKLQFLLALFVKPLFKWHKGLHWLPHACTYVRVHNLHTRTHTPWYTCTHDIKPRWGNYLRIRVSK